MRLSKVLDLQGVITPDYKAQPLPGIPYTSQPGMYGLTRGYEADDP